MVSVLSVAAFCASTATAAHLGNTQTYQDSVGEDSLSPDITSVIVSNDDAGMLTFQITIANRPTLTGHMDINIHMDINNNANDGCGPDCDGADIILDLIPGDIAYAPWSNGKWDYSVRSPASLTYSYTGGVATIKVKASDLSIPNTFNFYVFSDSDSTDANSHIDFAPDANHGVWNYTIKITPPAATPPASRPTAKAVPKCKKGQKSTAKKPCKK
jgi:hypothetical protein